MDILEKLNEQQREFLEEFDKMYDRSKLYKSVFFDESTIKSFKDRYNDEQNDIYYRCHRIDVDIASKDSLVFELDQTGQLDNNSKQYTAMDYVSNPYAISEDLLIRLIDKEKQYIKRKNKKDLKFSREESDRLKYKAALDELKNIYTGEKLSRRVEILKRRYKIE